MSSLRIFCGLWLGLYFLFLPFPTEILPEIGTFLSSLGIPITSWSTGTDPELLNQTYSFSDSIHQYVMTLFLGLLAGVLTLPLRKSTFAPKITPLLPKAIAYILAFFLLLYGIQKFTQLQFPEPPPNILHTPFGNLDKDILFWSTMGTSKWYGWFMGITEITAALLLLPSRTRYLGALISCGIFAHVFAINLGFDITVKLLSFALLCASVYVLSPVIRRFLQLMTQQEIDRPATENQPQITPQVRRVLKGIAVFLIFLECLGPLFTREDIWRNGDLIGQSYEVTEERKHTLEFIPSDVKRLHFHPGGSLIFESSDGTFTPLDIHYSSGNRAFTFTKNNRKITVLKDQDTWIFRSGNNILWMCQRAKNDQLPAVRDAFHWTVEGMIVQ